MTTVARHAAPSPSAVVAVAPCELLTASQRGQTWTVSRLGADGRSEAVGSLPPANTVASMTVAAGDVWVAGSTASGLALLARHGVGGGSSGSFVPITLPTGCGAVTAVAPYGAGVLAALDCAPGSRLLAVTSRRSRVVFSASTTTLEQLAASGPAWLAAGTRDRRPVAVYPVGGAIRTTPLDVGNLWVRSASFVAGDAVVGMERLGPGGVPAAVRIVQQTRTGEWQPIGPPPGMTDIYSSVGVGAALIVCGGATEGAVCFTKDRPTRPWRPSGFTVGEFQIQVSVGPDALWGAGTDIQIAPRPA